MMNLRDRIWLAWHRPRHYWTDKVWRAGAWRLPRQLVMWCYIRVGSAATSGEYGATIVPELSMMDALQRWTDKS